MIHREFRSPDRPRLVGQQEGRGFPGAGGLSSEIATTAPEPQAVGPVTEETSMRALMVRMREDSPDAVERLDRLVPA